ncbi:MAG: hypothetical protein RDV41_09945 [Planctomycetota bacterium]|nr:hypothetical protein [Planctomycetota bacterium]
MARRRTTGGGMSWTLNPDSGGVKIPPDVQERTRQRILAHAEKHYKGKYTRLDIRFRGQCCYIDAYREPDVPKNWPPKDWKLDRDMYVEQLRNTPTHLCRLRYFGGDRWSLAFYKYSDDKYELCVFHNGDFFGTPEEGLDVGAVYLNE